MNKIPKLKEFDLEAQYQFYLKLMKLTEREMHPEQIIQLKQAFYGGWGMVLMNLAEINLPTPIMVGIMEDMVKQIATFWDNEVKYHRANFRPNQRQN